MRVLFDAKNPQEVIVFMNRFPKVPSLLLIPPIAIGISERTLDRRGILVGAGLPYGSRQ